MGALLRLLLRNGGFVTFMLVEAFSFYLIIRFNEDKNAIFTHSAGIFAGNALERRQKWSDYFSLEERIDSLIKENARLQTESANARAVQVPYRDTVFFIQLDTLIRKDSATVVRHKIMRPQYEFIVGKAISNSISSANNWLIINRGSADNVHPDMGLVTGDGIVGIVRHVSTHFSMAMSVLHRQTKVSVNLIGNNNKKVLGSLLWEGGDPSLMTLKYIPRHVAVKNGMKVVTSGYSQLFPKDVMVGYLELDGIPMQDPENPYFWILKVRLSQDMATVNDVYVVNNIFNSELDSLQLKVKNGQ